MPVGLILKKKYSYFYKFPPIKRIRKTITAMTSNKWISPPPILRENPPSYEITNKIKIISSIPIFIFVYYQFFYLEFLIKTLKLLI